MSVASSPRPPTLWCLAVGHLLLLRLLLLLHQAHQHQARATTRNLLAKATRFRLKWKVLAAASAPLTVTAALAQPMCQLEPLPILCASCRTAARATSTALWHASWEDAPVDPSASTCPACWASASILTASPIEVGTRSKLRNYRLSCAPFVSAWPCVCQSICFHSVALVGWTGHC